MSRPIRIHRAGVLAMLYPGWGDWYAGRRGRGALLAVGCLVCLGWMVWVAARLFLDQVLGVLLPESSAAMPWMVSPLLQLAVSGLGLVWLWHLGIVTAILAARERCRGAPCPWEPLPWFAVLASWCAPGAGQVYAGRTRFGLGLLAGYLLGYLTLFPALQQVMTSAAEAMDAWRGTPPQALVSQVHTLATALRLEASFSLPWKLHELLRAFAIADVCAALASRPRSPSGPGNWSTFLAPMFGHLALGWICPGAGQFLQGRPQAGWCFFGMFWGLQLSGAILLTAGAMTLERLFLLQDVGTVLGVAAGVEACWRMALAARGARNP